MFLKGPEGLFLDSLKISNSMEQYRILYWHVRVIFKHTRIYQRTVASELSDECKKRTWTKYKLFMLHTIYVSLNN